MADENPKHRGCGTMQVHRRLLDSDPGYARRLERIEEMAFRSRFGGAAARPGCVEIPVIVHVVYKTTAQNVSDAQINSQIDVLNKDFRKTNADISQVPAPFSPLAGDARIQFALATQDPDGNPHSGVIRVQTTKTGFDSNDEVKFASSGGSDAWPRDDYLNLWVCQLGGGLLGYAQFPGGPAATDGVVVTHTGFGITGTAAAPFDKGRTTTHEVGHWLNLRHIWGDDGNGCSGSDFVDDTPNQGGPNYGKPSFPSVSCSNGPNGDMFMNYMDYVDDDTMVMFTECQITRMHACLDGPRSSIGRSIPCFTLTPKSIVKDGIKDPIKDGPKDGPKDVLKDAIKDIPKEGPKDGFKDPIKEFPKDTGKDFPKDTGKDLSKDPPKDLKEFPKDPPKDIKEGPKDGTKDPIFDPGGPKTIKEFGKDPITDPQKSLFEPPDPKTRQEGPFVPGGPFTPIQPVQPLQPLQPFTPMQPLTPVQPFVIGTGAPPGVAAQPSPIRAHYEQILAQYAGLHQRGLLDEQGMSAWQQAYAAWQQLGQ
jgi:hypothetical protein